ncbi:MAG: hypothetical protein GFH25_541186n384 [Chloroflexi bacterium AL-N10]|nr:hypothetical protein [Chloroflexi bacterium AL-N1]NOK66698.1 hypothetical protein [Chloroflexi bacterium AL-N10]NOK72086.1 hypothetical protein [Chloroflexi bacterium AL-N5]
MQCPLCPPTPLQRIPLEANLPAHTCSGCGGIFLVSSDYFQWREQHKAQRSTHLESVPSIVVTDVPKAKQCLFCRHIMLRYQVGHDVNIILDHCDNCNSVWFDHHKWDVLRNHNLHSDIHRIFTEAWQRRVRDADHRAMMEAIYREKFGSDDYTEVQRVKAWLDAHPQREALRAYLNAENPYRR